MKKLVIATGVAFICAAPAFAGPKDQTKDSLIGPQALNGNPTVNNQTTDFKMQAKGCKLQVKAKGLAGVSDADIIICIATADVISPPLLGAPGAGNGVILLGEVKSNGLKIKADLSEIGCGTAGALNFNGELKCYLDDATYRSTDPANPPTFGWRKDCADAAMAAGPNPHTGVDGDTLKVSGEPVVLGLCQGLTLGARPTGPGAALLIAQRGARGGP